MSACTNPKDVKPIPKPPLRNYHIKKTMRSVYTAIAISAASAVSFYVFWCQARKNRYKAFYAKYDAEKSFNRMKEAGIFHSVRPEEEEEKGKGKKK